MSLDRIIHSDDFTDANGELHYFNTGRDNVSGLSFPDHYVRNKDNYAYTRILNINLNSDTSLIYPIHECFLLTTYKNNNSSGITNIINIDAIVREGTVKPQDITVTCSSLNHFNDLIDIRIHEIYAAIKNESDNSVSLGIWLNTQDIIDILIKDLSSLAFNQIPNNIYRQFLQCDYNSLYLNNEDIIYDVNMFIFEESIGTKIATGKNMYESLINKIKNINDDLQTSIPDYQFLSVIYDDMYAINSVNTDEIIKPTSFQYVEVGNSFATINDDYITVNTDGNYIIALKVNMDIHEGMPSKMTMSLFLNDDRVEETTCTLYLDPSNKVHPLGFLSGQVRIQLKSSDKLYLKARWSDKDDVFIENHCTLQITKLNQL